jgi:T-complex protein 1 subunit zeta
LVLICDAQEHRLVGGVGDIKLTKDGNTLLKEMVNMLTVTLMMTFRRPLDSIVAQDDSSGDGITSTVLFTGVNGELLRQSEWCIEGLVIDMTFVA